MSPSGKLLYVVLLLAPPALAQAPALGGPVDGGSAPPVAGTASHGAPPSLGPPAGSEPRPSGVGAPGRAGPLPPGPQAPAPGAAPTPSAPTVVPPVPAVPPVPPPGPPAERDRWLRARLDEVLGQPRLATTQIGIAVVEVDTGRALYVRNDGALLNPASNVKLITTAAALALLGPEYRWKTVLLADALKNGVIEGNLYLRGYGDPSLVSEDLWKIASQLAALGVRRVSGDLVVDDTYFDEQRVGPGFEQKDEDFPFRAPNGAVSLNYNACAVRVMPGTTDGAPARVVVEPASPYFVTVADVKTAARGKTALAISSHEVEGHTEVRVSGTIRLGENAHVEHRRIAHPDLYAAHSLRELLARRGVKVGGKITNGPAPQGARLLVTHYSNALGIIVRDVNKHSNNFMAEQVLKTIGAETAGKPGTWQKGVDGVGRFLEGLGIARARYKMTNGSGLYDSNRFSATQFVTLLRSVYRDFRFAADFVGSLAVSGAEGTIRHRMEGGLAERFVRAKTGTLNGISCLSGYAGATGRMPLAFAILMNEIPEIAAADARRTQDLVAEALVNYLSSK